MQVQNKYTGGTKPQLLGRFLKNWGKFELGTLLEYVVVFPKYMFHTIWCEK